MCQVSGGAEKEKAISNSYASITWIRFYGSSAFRAELSAHVVPADGRLAPRSEITLRLRVWSVKAPVRPANFITHDALAARGADSSFLGGDGC